MTNVTPKPFHHMADHEFTDFVRNALNNAPEADWDKLKVHDRVTDKKSAWQIVSIPPKRGFVMATNIMHPSFVGSGSTTASATRLKKPRGLYGGDKLYTVTEDLARLLGVKSHEEILRQAIEAGEDIPLIVQADYPLDFSIPPRQWDAETREEAQRSFNRLREFCFVKPPGWQQRDLEYNIAVCEAEIRRQHALIPVLKSASLESLRLNAEEYRNQQIEHCGEEIKRELRQIDIAHYLIRHFDRTLGRAIPENPTNAPAVPTTIEFEMWKSRLPKLDYPVGDDMLRKWFNAGDSPEVAAGKAALMAAA